MRMAGIVALLALATSNVGAASRQAGTQPVADGPLIDGPLCRRAAPMPSLAPEPRIQQDRQSARDAADIAAPPAVYAPAPPPPPPAPSPPPPPPAPAEDIVVTGSAMRAPPSSSVMVAPAPAPAPMTTVPTPPPPPTGSAFAPRDPQQRPAAGLLTAGEHDDLLNPELYARYVDAFLAREPLAGVPRVDTARVLSVAVRDAAGRAVPFAAVTLTCADGNTLSLATLADGTAVFFPDLDRLGASVRVAVPGGGTRNVPLTGASGATATTITLSRSAAEVRRMDLALVVDTTGSMGDELRYLNTELAAVVARLKRAHPALDLRIALIVYRDVGDDYVTRTYPFTADLAATQRAIAPQVADGGGDTPEAVEQALARAAALPWRGDAVRSMLLVADAPPHADDVAATWRAAEALRALRVQVVPVAASGVDDGAEYIMRAMAAATQSRYLFLSDDSGIGNPHAAPAIDCYKVTSLAAAVRRVLDAQVSGQRIEPEPAEVIRTVGRYDAGRCILPAQAQQ